MDNVLGVALTALVGLAGIASTHLLARSQRGDEAKRQDNERKERYRFSRYETEASLCAEFVGELRALEVAVRLRDGVAGRFKRNWTVGLSDKARASAEKAEDPEFVKQLLDFAKRLDDDPQWAEELARSRPETGLPPPVEAPPIVRRLAELSARLQIHGGNDVSHAARKAQGIATSVLLMLDSSEVSGLKEPIDLNELTASIDLFVAAAVYELRLVPHGSKETFAELIAHGNQEARHREAKGSSLSD